MNTVRDIEPELVDPKQELIVLHRQLQQQSLLKTNRMLLAVSTILMAIILVLGSFLASSHDMVTELKEKQILEADNTLKNPVVSPEVDALKSQLISLISGSIESKLKSLEKSINRNKPLTALETVKSLKSDVKALRNYAKPQVAPEKKPEMVTTINLALVREVSQLKNLIYLTLGSCGLMFAALAGIWFKGRKQLTSNSLHYLEKKNG